MYSSGFAHIEQPLQYAMLLLHSLPFVCLRAGAQCLRGSAALLAMQSVTACAMLYW